MVKQSSPYQELPQVIGRKHWLVILAVGAIVVLGAYWHMRTVREVTVNRAHETLTAVLDLKVAKITRWMNERRGDAMQSTERSEVVAFLENPSGASEIADIHRWIDSMRRDYGYQAVSVWDIEGELLLANPAFLQDELLAFDEVSPVMHASGQVAFTPLQRTLTGDGVHFGVTAPVTSSSGERGLVFFLIDAESFLFPVLESWPIATDTAETLLVRREGDEIFFLNELRHRSNTALRLSVSLSDSYSPAVDAVMTERSFVRGVDYRGQTVLAATKRVPGTDWAMEAKIDEAEVLAELNGVRLALVLGSASLLVSFAILLFFMLKIQGREFGRRQSAERQQAVRGREESLLRSQMVMEATGIGIWEWDIASGDVSWDAQMMSIYGMEDRESNDITYDDWRDRVVPEDAPQQERLLNDLAEGRGGGKREFRIRREKDDELRVISAIDTVRFKESGAVEKIVGVNLDVTEIRQTEEEVLKLSETVKQSPVSIAITNLEGKIEFTNPHFSLMTGYSAEEVRGRDLDLLIVAGERDLRAEELKQTLAKGNTWSGIFQNKKKNGDPFWEEMTVSPIRESSGRICHFVWLKVDVTGHKNSEDKIRRLASELESKVAERTQELELANAELESFSYSVSHDLRAPLRAIDGWAQVLVEDYRNKLDEAGERAVDRLRGAAQRMGRLIDALLKLSRINRHEVDATTVVMSSLLDKVLFDLRAAADQPLPIFEVEDLQPAYGSAALLEQVFVNLLSNAAKFTRDTEDARVRVGCMRSESGETIYYVKDNGAGFDMRYVGKLFGAFQRLHSAKEFQGTGIGLALCKRIITRHGGRIWAEGHVGGGAAFYFTLPPPHGVSADPETHHSSLHEIQHHTVS